MEETPRCPRCGSDNIAEYVYTKLHSDKAKAKEQWKSFKKQGRIFGGDIVFPDSPAYKCRKCRKKFGSYDDIIKRRCTSRDE